MKKISAGTSLLMMMIVGCGDVNTSSSATLNAEVPEAYLWLSDANVAVDIKSFVDKDDYRLIAIANRGKTIVGLSEGDDTALLASRCGVRFLSGLGDTIASTEDKQWRDRALEYASAFNAGMKKICLEK